MNLEEYKAENVYEDGNIQISNSVCFNNPIAQLVYSNYLYENVKKEDGTNFFNGDPYDIVGEWQTHNFAAQITGIAMVALSIPLSLVSFGDQAMSKIYGLHSSSVHVDLGPNINSDNRGIVRFVSKLFKWAIKISSINILEW